MNYYVLLDNGQRFGPADINLLNQWAAEGRILASTLLEQEGTGNRIYAQQVPGLHLPQTGGGAWAQPPSPTPYAGYQRPVAYGDNGSNDLTTAWILTALSWVVIPVIGSVFGIVMANKAIQKGNQAAQAAKTFAIISLVLQSIGMCCTCGSFSGMLGGLA